tara:strand:- start:276 stop:680 length:405 start_codon:yes stop_codon:yes gene_type:complete
MFSNAFISTALKITAVVNLIAGSGAVLAPSLNTSLLLGPEVTLDAVTLRYHLMVWMTVLIMGICYAVASKDPEKQSALVLAGGLGKLMVASIWVEMFMVDLAAPLILLPICFDALLGILFAVFGIRTIQKAQGL